MAVVKLLQVHPGGTGPLVLGETFLEKFEVRSLLGKGGHAWVYECFDRFLQRPVAVKVIKTLRESGRDLSRRARAEAQVLAGMQHPNLVRVLDAGMLSGLVYIVMEKLEGRTLRHTLISLSRCSVRETLNIAIQVADGMQLAHDNGVIHRDLKPENIFIEAGNRVKVLDFGVAKVLGASHVTTQKDQLQGTVFYMSPEQLQGVAVTPASDVFALGTMMFEMLYGHPLTLGGGDLPNNEHVAWMQLYKVPPPLESLDQGIPRYVGKLVGRAIVKLPTDRFKTMRELRDAAVKALQRYETEIAAVENAATPRELSGLHAPGLVAVPQEGRAPKPAKAPEVAAPPKPRKASLPTVDQQPSKSPPATAYVDGARVVTSPEPVVPRSSRFPKALLLGVFVGLCLIAAGQTMRRRTLPTGVVSAAPLVSPAATHPARGAIEEAALETPPGVPHPAGSVAETTVPTILPHHTATVALPKRAQRPSAPEVNSGLWNVRQVEATGKIKPVQPQSRQAIF